MSGTSHKPPMFSKNNKFDKTNSITFKNLITMTTEMKEVMEYLNSSIKNLDKPVIKPQIVIVMTVSELIPWNYDKPTVSKWKAQNA